jgi:threonine aldolase
MIDVRNTGADAQQWIKVLANYEIHAASAQPDVIRLVTHRHITEVDIDRAIAAFREIYVGRPKALFAA